MPKLSVAMSLGVLSGAVLIAMSSTGCALSGQAEYKRKLAETGTPAMHGVQNDRLRELMGNMSQLRDESDYSRPLELQQDRDQCATVARSLAESAGKLPDLAPSLKLDEHETKVYLGLAAKLRQQALAYADTAQRGTFRELNQSMDQMMATCNACHSLFRGPRVPGSPPAARK
ncbi:MAG TPA: hypothetical protein VMV94_02295 [Phycisphaerae bacterium]|nr:hypothetical protein [Phycisphaerae bacterium]